MIRLEDYQCLNKEDRKQFKSKLLSQVGSRSSAGKTEGLFTDELQHKYVVRSIRSAREFEAYQFLIQNGVFCQRPIIMKHKSNSNSALQKQKFLFVLQVKDEEPPETLTEYTKNKFCRSLNSLPDESFCCGLIETMLQFFVLMKKHGIKLSVLTPDLIVVYRGQFYLKCPMEVDLTAKMLDFADFQKFEKFCAPEILNTILHRKQNENKQNPRSKQFQKAFIYSLGLCVLSCFGLEAPIKDRYEGLKHSKYLTKYFDEMRDQVKTFHQSKYVSKVLKLMLESSETLRDNAEILVLKMNSAQFMFLRKVQTVSKSQNTLMQTESDAVNSPAAWKRTEEIIISNNSSQFNRSSVENLSISEGLSSPVDFCRPSMQVSKNRRLGCDLNEIEQERQNSVVEIEIEWEDESYGGNRSNPALALNVDRDEHSNFDSSQKIVGEFDSPINFSRKKSQSQTGKSPSNSNYSHLQAESQVNMEPMGSASLTKCDDIFSEENVGEHFENDSNIMPSLTLNNKSISGRRNALSKTDIKRSSETISIDKSIKIESKISFSQKQSFGSQNQNDSALRESPAMRSTTRKGEKQLNAQQYMTRTIEEVTQSQEGTPIIGEGQSPMLDFIEEANEETITDDPFAQTEQKRKISRKFPPPLERIYSYPEGSANFTESIELSSIVPLERQQTGDYILHDLSLGNRGEDSLMPNASNDSVRDLKPIVPNLGRQREQEREQMKQLLKKDEYNDRSRSILGTLGVIYLVYVFIEWVTGTE